MTDLTALRPNPSVSLSCRGRLLYGNGTEDSEYRRAFTRGDLLRFDFYLPRQCGATAAEIVVKSDADGSVMSHELHWECLYLAEDRWSCTVKTEQMAPGLYYIKPTYCGIAGTVTGIREDGVTCHFATDTDVHTYQLTISEFAYPAPTFMEGGIMYQIFVDRFCRGAETPVREDAILYSVWEGGTPEYPPYPGAPLENNTFFGGNLQGITAKLDYLASLGVTCLYLTPIFEAYSNHKYDTGDYMTVDAMFGGEAALRDLLREVKKRGMRLILDGVFNHTGDDSVYFNRRGRYASLGAYQSKESPYYPWYDFQEFPDRYTCWWNIPILPRIHTEVPSCREYFLQPGGVIDRYASMGVDGFRLDVVDELPDSFVDGIKERLDRTNRENVLYGEVWEDASNKVAYGRRRRYYTGRQLDGVMNYELRRGILQFLRHRDPAALRYALTEVMPNTPRRILNCQMNLIGTHDTMRILTALAGETPEGHSNDELAQMRLTEEQKKTAVERLKIAYTILATLPGVPMIYYGDEVGMEGYSDPFNRRPFPWHHTDDVILEHYRSVGRIRHGRPEYRNGAFRLLRLDTDTLAYERTDGAHTSLILVNNGDDTKTFVLPSGVWRDLTSEDSLCHESFVVLPHTATILGKE